MPRSKEAFDNLRQNSVREGIDVEFLPIPSEEFFERLWSQGIFTDINSACDALIDDYEETELASARLTDAIQILTERHSVHGDRDIHVFCQKLQDLCRQGASLGYPLFFVL